MLHKGDFGEAAFLQHHPLGSVYLPYASPSFRFFNRGLSNPLSVKFQIQTGPQLEVAVECFWTHRKSLRNDPKAAAKKKKEEALAKKQSREANDPKQKAERCSPINSLNARYS